MGRSGDETKQTAGASPVLLRVARVGTVHGEPWVSSGSFGVTHSEGVFSDVQTGVGLTLAVQQLHLIGGLDAPFIEGERGPPAIRGTRGLPMGRASGARVRLAYVGVARAVLIALAASSAPRCPTLIMGASWMNAWIAPGNSIRVAGTPAAVSLST
jgi:hypothetical protein